MNPSASHPSEEMYCPGCENTFYGVEYCPNDGAKLVRLQSQPDQLIGRTFDGRYTIVEKLGEGGMGSVYRSRQHSFGREVAIKVVNPGLVTDPMIIKRFLREAKLSSRLSHPNAVAVLDFGQTDDGIFYLVMELVNGRTLHDAMSQTPQFPPERVVRIGAQMCDALECAHDLGIVHRDLKPSNVMLLTSGRDLVKVLDFGLAKSLAVDDRGTTMTGTRGGLMGTPAFVAPELALGRSCDHRADLYSLGCILYLIGSGWPPFSAENGAELISKHAYELPAMMPNTPAPLADVVMRLLAKNPQDRYASAAETRQALEDALGMPQAMVPVSLPISASGSQSWPRSERANLSHPGNGRSLSVNEEAPMMLTDDVTSVSVRAESPTRIVHTRRPVRVAPAIATFLVLALLGGGGYYYWYSTQGPGRDDPGRVRVQQINPDAALPSTDPARNPATPSPKAVDGSAAVPAAQVDAGTVTLDAGEGAMGEGNEPAVDPNAPLPPGSVTVEVSRPTIIDPASKRQRKRKRGEPELPAEGSAATPGTTPVAPGPPSPTPPPDGSGVVPASDEFESPYRPGGASEPAKDPKAAPAVSPAATPAAPAAAADPKPSDAAKDVKPAAPPAATPAAPAATTTPAS
jgi:eukaryotic-like serine/threonine-protein kinase